MSVNLVNPGSSGASGYGNGRRCTVRFQQRCDLHDCSVIVLCTRRFKTRLNFSVLVLFDHHRNRTPVASLEYMEDQSSGHCVASQQDHTISTVHRPSMNLADASMIASNSTATSTHHQHQLQFAVRVGGFQNPYNEKEDSLSPAVPSLLHLPLCRQTTPVPGLRYRNLGKSGLRVSNVGLGTINRKK